MSPTRREFMRIVGLTIAALLTSDCNTSASQDATATPLPTGQDATAAPPPTSTPDRNLEVLRNCWLRLDWLEGKFQEGQDKGQQAQRVLLAEHRAALDELIVAGEMDPAVADLVQVAFDAAAHYNDDAIETVVEIICYVEPTPIPGPPPTPTPYPTPEPVDVVAERKLAEYISASKGVLALQAGFLAEMAIQSDLDSDTVAYVQTIIQRDLTLLNLSDHMRESLRDQMVQAYRGTYRFPVLDQLDVEISPEAAEATRFLVELLLENEN